MPDVNYLDKTRTGFAIDLKEDTKDELHGTIVSN